MITHDFNINDRASVSFSIDENRISEDENVLIVKTRIDNSQAGLSCFSITKNHIVRIGENGSELDKFIYKVKKHIEGQYDCEHEEYSVGICDNGETKLVVQYGKNYDTTGLFAFGIATDCTLFCADVRVEDIRRLLDILDDCLGDVRAIRQECGLETSYI